MASSVGGGSYVSQAQQAASEEGGMSGQGQAHAAGGGGGASSSLSMASFESKYAKLDKGANLLGEGTYGEVFKVKNVITGEYCFLSSLWTPTRYLLLL